MKNPSASVLADHPEALRAMLGHHHREVIDAAPDLLIILGVAFQQGGEMQGVVLGYPIFRLVLVST